MNTVAELIRARRSVRTFDGREVEDDLKEQLLSYAAEIRNPFEIPVTFKLLSAKKEGLSCPVVSGTDLFVGGKLEKTANGSVAFGYSFEAFVLYAQSQGLGTVWVGGTMNRDAFEKAMSLSDGEIMPCVSPIGYTAKKMSLREKMMRTGVKADTRMPFETLFFKDSFAAPLKKSEAGFLTEPLEMVRLAPSAVNKQPWRIIVRENAVHFYLKRSSGFGHSEKLDMQMVDMGIAMCHFATSAEENGIKLGFEQRDPELANKEEVEYVGTYRIC